MKPSLLVLAAGMGSRYGGLKQMDQFGPSGETLLEYSIYDAMRAGFEKVTFVLRSEIEAAFKENYAGKFAAHMEIKYALQELDAVPPGFEIPAGRKKPWGTAHAVLVARDAIAEPFAVINADDFYGAQSYRSLYDYLAGVAPHYCLVGFKVINTLSEHGGVSRATCSVDGSGFMQTITERQDVKKHGEQVSYRGEHDQPVQIPADTVVSMNQMGFTPGVFEFFAGYFEDFLRAEGTDPKAEFALPTALNEIISTGREKVKILNTDASWFGVTYREDKPRVQSRIRDLIAKGVYPQDLWK
jgi:dTDP-glucose pyrophosphorylase